MQEFNPEVKRAKRNGQTVWEVDCRTWAGLMNQIQRPLRRRFRTRREAQRWCYQLVVDVRIGREPDPGPMALLDLCDLYLQSIKNSDKSKETYKTYKSLLRGRRFTGFLERRAIVDVCDLNPAELEHYRQQCHAELSAAGVQAALTAIKTMFRWSERCGLTTGNPADTLEIPTSKARRRPFTEDEREKLLKEASPANLPIWQLLLLTGLRHGEIVALTVDDVVLDAVPGPFVRVRQGKGKKQRNIPLTAGAQRAAQVLLDDAKAAGRERLLPFGYSALGERWVRERERLGLPSDLCLHSFRHCFASTLSNRTKGGIEVAADALGHSTTGQTEVYRHKDQAFLREAMAELDDLLLTEEAPEMAAEAVSDG